MNLDHKNYTNIIDILIRGNIRELEELAELLNDFPKGSDDYINRKWIINAVDVGAVSTVEWMLSKSVELDFRDCEGYTPILSALEREEPDKHEILKLLINHGAPINQKGVNDWTPLHMAAARNDVTSLRILIEHGADKTIRTEIDDYATPLEEAVSLDCKDAVKYLQSIA